MKPNRSKTYLLPLLLMEIKFNKRYFRFIKNSYIRDRKKRYTDCIFLEFHFLDNSTHNLISDITKNELFLTRYKLENKDIYVFKFPPRFMREYKKFLQSRYSEFGRDAKVYITNF